MKVRVVRSGPDSALVEYIEDGLVQRAVIGASMITSTGHVKYGDLKEAAPYGVPVAELVRQYGALEYDPTKLQQAIRNRGLWTHQDLKENPPLVQAAMREALGLDFATLINLVMEHERKHGD